MKKLLSSLLFVHGLLVIPLLCQAITQDIERFAESVAELYSNITKPVLDMLIYVRRLSHTVSARGDGIIREERPESWFASHSACAKCILCDNDSRVACFRT